MSEANAEKEALGQIRGSRTSYTDTDADGMPNTVRTTTPGAAMNLPNTYLQTFGRLLYGGQIGPWTKKKK
jgi:hypothetical protein